MILTEGGDQPQDKGDLGLNSEKKSFLEKR